MSLGYTVNWIEQGRTASENEESGEYEVFQTEHRIVNQSGHYFRQSRTRTGTTSYSRRNVYAEITYKAVTTSLGVITETQAAEIQRDAYTNGCENCTTAREQGPTFSVTKVVRDATPLSTQGTSSTAWNEWGDWGPTLPSAS